MSGAATKWLGIAARMVAASLGLWMMAAPSIYEHSEVASAIARILGPLIATVAIVAITESTRPLRHANLVLGIAISVSIPIAGAGVGAIVNAVSVGVAVALLSRVRGALEHELGGGWRAIWRPPRPTLTPRE